MLASEFRLIALPGVVREAEWGLRSRFKLDRGSIAHLFSSMMASQSIIVNEEDRLARTIAGFAEGMDFADAMHVCFTSSDETSIPFDGDLVRLAARHIKTASVALVS